MAKLSFECLDTPFGRGSYSLSAGAVLQVVRRIVEDPRKTGYARYWRLPVQTKPITVKSLSDDLKSMYGAMKNMKKIRNSLVPSTFLDGSYLNTYGDYINSRFAGLCATEPNTEIGTKVEGEDGVGHLHACGIWVNIYDMRAFRNLMGVTLRAGDEVEITGIACSDRAFIGQIVLSALDKLQRISVRVEDLY